MAEGGRYDESKGIPRMQRGDCVFCICLRMPDLSQRQAWLCAAPNAAQEPLTDARQEIRPGGEHRFAFSANREGQRAAALLQRRDANGNILPGSESYMKTVYRAFPLGDGFA